MAKLRAVDFFCSIGGMTHGFRTAGIDVIAGLDIDPSCKETYEYNNPGTKFIQADIKKYSFEQLEKDVKIKKDDDKLIFIGCSPCQYWSIINTDKTKSNGTKNLLTDFQKFVKHFNPGYVVVENVPGILRNADESGLTAFINMLGDMKYKVDKEVLNANHYGVPQNRKRFSLIASRVKQDVKLPEPQIENAPVVKDFIGEKKGFCKIKAGHRDTSDFMHTVAGLSDINLKRLKVTKKNGGGRHDWKDNDELQLNCYIGKDDSFTDIYGRMSWDKPAPTITTKFYSISNGRFGHPVENRAISLREGATLQTFPKKYVFKEKSIGKVAKHIGNAVPPVLAQKIANSIKK